MKRLLICLLLLLCLGSQNLLAETFIVTTTNHSGPGSLRDALEKAAANGTRDTDYIHFNIAAAREFTIKVPIANPLPPLTSNLVIDGTTQRSGTLGVSNAKLCVTIEGVYTGTNPLVLFNCKESSNIKIYGLFLKGNVGHPLTGARPLVFTAIHLQQTQDITIGAPDKGNVISGWTKGIHEVSNGRIPATSNVRISNNIFGLDPDGVSINFNDRNKLPANNTHSIYFDKCANGIYIGGNTAAEGNIFNSSNTDIHVEGTLNSDYIVSIKNNRFGIDYNGDNLNSSSLVAINVLKIDCSPLYYAVPASPIITHNYIGGKSRGAGIAGADLRTNTDILNNVLGFEDRSGAAPRDVTYGAGIYLTRTFQSKIRNNIIRYWTSGAIILEGDYSINVSKNSTYCNRKRAIEIREWFLLSPPQRKQPYAYINRLEAFRGTVSGTSLPDNTIELFYNDEDCPTCEGKTWFATVQADAQGNWSYNGPLTGDNVVATATEIFASTSEYSMPVIDKTNAVISPVTCNGGYGSICGLKILSGTKWRWEDETGNVVGYDTCLRMVPAGKYFFKLSVGSSCEESFPFTIPDVSPAIDESAVRTTTARCGQPNGSICGIRVRNGVSQQWEDEAGNVVSTSVCFNNARPGKYRLRLDGQGGCTVYSSYYEVPNKVPGVDATAATITHPSCGKDNGSITGIRLFDTDFSTFGWYNDAGVLISTSADLRNAAPGRYKLVVKDNSGACGDSTAFFTLNIVPPPSMNAAAVQVLDASCGNANGSIKGITFSNTTGTVEYWWVNLAGTVVSTTPDLVDAPPGSYRLKMKDKSNCDTLFSPFYDIEDRGGVSLDALAVTVTPTGCKKLSGAIRGITANGADLLEWRNTATGAVVGTGADITSLPEGTYQLTATNTAFGCSVKSAIYTVTLAPPMDLQVLAENVNQASCGLNNGSIEIRDIGNNTAFFTFRWLKDSVVEVGTGLVISDLEPATYHCIATDTNGCEIAFYKKTITALPLPALNENNVSITADTCEFKSGRIAGIVVNSDGGGIQYSWRTLAGVEVATTLQLSGAPAGDYYLFVTDGRGCTIRSRNYNVPAVTTSFTAPRYIAQHNISRNSNLRLQPSGTNRAGTYTLYDRSTGQVVAENTSGVFDLVNVATDRELYVVLITGPCSSQQAIIRIKVFDETNLTIPNAFSPNGDNINDEFRVQVVGLFNLNYLRIFNRYGQMVYETRDLNLPWKGTHNGNPLPVGTYYWLIDGIGMHNKPVKRSGSITLIR